MPTSEQVHMDRKHIFAVNGAVEFLDLIRELLQEEHFNITTTNFVPATYDQIEALQPDLLIIDLAVGQRAGWHLLEQLAASVQTQGIPIIVVSTSPKLLTEVQQSPNQFGGARFMSKPLDLDDVLQAVDELIGQA